MNLLVQLLPLSLYIRVYSLIFDRKNSSRAHYMKFIQKQAFITQGEYGYLELDTQRATQSANNHT
ncbi:hypothetical protein OnM2_05177 [Erysiphe neolycopersici]|uniref:Uncharacterized protein n=1 Tax=Erysiphe neolycopersici TaxID=212602 RepID=A0A420HCZ7_9PEZI|nr:hypothetical protein OnM2_05177 [Erysiphe neolycopersici]